MAGASFYAQYGSRLSRYSYPQLNVLGAYLARVTDVRYAGLFDRPLPYRPFDPLRVALPALPWLFAGCVAGFVVLSIRTVRGAGRRRPGDLGPGGTPARLAGLSALAVELSLLTDARSDPSLVRASAGCGRPGTRSTTGCPTSTYAGCWPTRRPSWTRGPGRADARLPAGRLPAGEVVVTADVRRWSRRLVGTAFGRAVLACLALAGWALWSGGLFDGPVARQVRASSVYAAPGVDLDRAAAERVIGNRRLVVLMLRAGHRPARGLRRHRAGHARARWCWR